MMHPTRSEIIRLSLLENSPFTIRRHHLSRLVSMSSDRNA